MESGENKMCPSSTCHTGALLLGVVQSDKKIALLQTPMPVTEDFVEKAFKAGDPEKRLRFAGRCAKSGCSQWTGSRCGVIDDAMKQMEFAIDNVALPKCDIRPDCRWFNQNGADACKVCPYIITDTRPFFREHHLVDAEQ
jgi:hypothetical protein